MKKISLYLLFFFCFTLNCLGATYYVSTNGNDTTGNGSIGTPYRTVQKGVNIGITAGDIISVAPGNYDEYVVTKANGTSGNRITILSQTTYGARIRGFRANNHTYNSLIGFQLSHPSDINLAHVRIEASAHNTIISNNLVGPGTYIISTNANFGTDYINCNDVNFTDSGFVAGSITYWGSSGFGNLWYTNHDTTHTVSSISGDGHTMYVTDTMTADTRSNLWAFIYAGNGNNGFDGISCIIGSGINCPTNIIIANNIISNTVGAGFRGPTDGGYFINNTVRNIPSFYGMVWNGRNGIIRSNLWLDNLNVLWYTGPEIANLVHPPDASWYDYQVGHLGGFNTDLATNNIFEYNWVQNIDNQLGIMAHYNTNNGFMYRSNVFVGIQAQYSVSRNGVSFLNNTFLTSSYDGASTRAYILTMGGVGGNTQSNLVVNSNAFVNIGYHGQPNNEGAFSVTASTNCNLDNNFITSTETMGWQARTLATNSWALVNGGDPLFRDIRNPLGPDGLPFTADDGLRPLPNSPLAIYGLGALPPLSLNSSSTPIPHFTQTTTTTWQDNTTTNYDSVWATNTPYYRGGNLRPYTTPEALGSIPITIEFTATNSISGLPSSTNYYGIRFYKWDFGDGTTLLSVLPNVCHTYVTTGQVMVTLWVTNYAGSYSGCSNIYRLLPQTNSVNIWSVKITGNDTTGNGSLSNPWRTVQKAANNVNAGDFVVVYPGSYGENIDITRSATLANRITFVSLGATVGSWNMRKSDYTVEGFGNDFSNIGGAGGAFHIYANTTNIVVRNNTLGPYAGSTKSGVYFAQGSDGLPDTSQQYHSISNNNFSYIDSIQIIAYGRGHKFMGNYFHDGNGQCDLFRVWGADSVISYNYATNICPVSENHADIYQIFGPNGTTDYIMATNIVIENNTVLNGNMQVCQIETFDNPVGYFTNIVWRNNIFNVIGQANLDANGFKFYNNLFYKCVSGGGSVFVFGGPKGDAYGSEIKNNIFFKCGNASNSGQGWYSRMEDQSITNYSLEANYNFVVGTNYNSKDIAPPNSASRWGSSGGNPLNTWEVNGINGGDPSFVSEIYRDFRLKFGSPLINAGTTISGFTTDFRGNTRSSWDIGPFEYLGENNVIPTKRLKTAGNLRIIQTSISSN